MLVGFSVGGNTLLALLARDPRPALALVTIGASARGDPSRVNEIMTGPWPDYLKELEHTVGERPEHWRSSAPCSLTTGPGTSTSPTRTCGG